jgi:hypothetical protein
MRYLVYHQSQHCDQFVNWRILEVDDHSAVQPIRPTRRTAVQKTFAISIISVILGILLIVASVQVLSEFSSD